MELAPNLLRHSAHRRLTIVLVFALLAPSLGAAMGYDTWGWVPEHGHVALGAVAPDHHHPWDAAPTGASDGQRLGVTPGGLLGAPALPVLLLVGLVLPVLLTRLVAPRVEVFRLAPLPLPEPPPPR
ncbi:MAG: hypothetical protein Q8M79_09665 [Dehalococcoidia bacterium]|nr:hypothetical protein [Dehalococcoidia bacterium]